MALPKLNDLPLYDLVIPSTQQKVRFRPYLVKEEKILMMAMETQDNKQILSAVADTILSCVQEEINRKDLTSFDIEYMFLQIRSKSVGEASHVLINCSECSNKQEVSIDISKIETTFTKAEPKIQLNDNIMIEMQYPSFESVLSVSEEGLTSQTELGFRMIAQCIKTIKTEEEVINTSDVSKQEIIDFIESMNNEQFKKVNHFLESIPRVSETIEFNCSKCNHHNKVTLEGLSDFF